MIEWNDENVPGNPAPWLRADGGSWHKVRRSRMEAEERECIKFIVLQSAAKGMIKSDVCMVVLAAIALPIGEKIDFGPIK